jgi:hypothetical protein
LRDAFDDVYQYDVRQLLIGDAESAIGAYVSSADHSDFFSHR